MQQNRDRFDKFDDQARRALAMAQEEAQHFQHNYIGTEHLLLGLLRLEESTAAQVLNKLGVQLQQVRNAVEFIIGRGDRIVLGQIGLTPRSKKVIELAVSEARRLDHHYIGTEHILLGLVREGQGIAAGVLESMDVRLARVRQATMEVLGRADQAAESDTLADEDQPDFQEEGRATIVGIQPVETYQEERLLAFARDYIRGEKQAEPIFSPIQDADDLVPAPAGEEDYGNRFTLRTRRVLVHAREEARSQQKEHVGSEHLLLALLREQNGIAFHVLRNLGVDNAQLRVMLQTLSIQESFREQMGTEDLTINGQKAIWLAIDEARLLNQSAIGTEHLLIGLLSGGGISASALTVSGLNLDRARAEIRSLRGF